MAKARVKRPRIERRGNKEAKNEGIDKGDLCRQREGIWMTCIEGWLNT